MAEVKTAEEEEDEIEVPAEIEEAANFKEEEPVEEVVDEPVEEYVEETEWDIVEKLDSSDHEPTQYVNPTVTERNVLKVFMNQLLKQFKSPGQAPIDRYQDRRSLEEELTELRA